MMAYSSAICERDCFIMKSVFTAVALIMFLAGAALPALAFETPVTSEKGKTILNKMGTDLTPIAARLGNPHFVWADFIDNGRVAALVYTPVEKNFKASPRKSSIAVYALPGKAEEDKKIMTAAAQGLVAGYQKQGKIVKQDVFQNAKGEPGLFLEYTLGEGDKKEHSAGVFVRLTPFTAAFIQLQSRGKALSADDVAKVKELIGVNSNSATGKAPTGKKG